MADIDFDTVADLGGIEHNTIALECPYKDRCTDAGVKCATCIHNPKRSYYEPLEPTLLPEPYYPRYPFYPYYPTTTGDCNRYIKWTANLTGL